MAKTVLIVDDIEFVRKTLAEILTAARYQVIGEAADGTQAIEMYRRLKPDVVTMDIVMPKMSGIEAIRKIMQADNNARIVIISAVGQENLIMDAITVGAKDYITKPFSSAEVLKTIERALSDEVSHSKPIHRDQKAI